MYSALKKDGQPLYKLARAGEVVEREARSVTIARLELLGLEGEQARLSVDCSKGTYIRTLVEDLGQLLGCGAHVAELRRTKAGPFEPVSYTHLDVYKRQMSRQLHPSRLPCGSRLLDLSRPQVMGILNVTPDSFSDGGRFTARDAALRHAEAMVAAGATLIDIGGELSLIHI